MFKAKRSEIATSVLMILSASGVMLANCANIAQAQLFPQSSPARTREYRAPHRNPNSPNLPNLAPNVIPAGFLIPMGFEEEKILVTPEETVPLTLLVAADVKDVQRNILIPYGSEVSGYIEPSPDESGSWFVAEEIILPNGTIKSLDATSTVVTRREIIEEGANAGDVLQGAVIGAAAATVLSEVFGDIDAIEVIGGAGAGALAGLILGGSDVELVSIDPNNDLHLTLETNLALR